VKRKTILAVALLAALAALGFAQSRDTGAIVGKVMDEQKTGLPGATLSLTGKNLMGKREIVSDANGNYRFPALPPGEYAIKATLQGFKPVTQEAIRVSTTLTLTVDLTMTQAALAEEVTVLAKSPTVDVKSTETASVTLSNEILRNIPYSQFTSDIVNMAPGVVSNVAFGASQNTGIAYTVDGVNVADPEAGSAWVFLDHNIIEESKIMGIGLPAEYGNFTGVIFNLITKSGGNTFSGHMEFDLQGLREKPTSGPLKSFAGKFWQAVNNGAYVADFPKLTPPKMGLMDGNAHLGGPIKKDKIWFYAGAQWYESWTYPTGFPEPRDYYQPRWFGKISAQPSNTLSLMATLEIDTYNGNKRGGSATTAVNATVDQVSPEVVANFSLNKILNPKTFVDVKLAYFWGYYYLDPEVGTDINAHYDTSNNNFLYGSAGYFFYADRTRLQVNASLTHFAEDFIKGDHDFKFGVEVERSTVRNRSGYTGKNHMVYWDYSVTVNKDNQVTAWDPYLAYQYEGYDTNTNYTRIEGFAQDAWQITDRININFGLRVSQNWGDVKGVSGAVYKSTRLAPRIGFTFDILGDKTTVLKAHYGQFTEAMLSSYHDRMNPDSAYKDYIAYYWDNKWVEFDRTVHESLYTIADGIHHPYLSQFTVSLERELFKDASFSISYIRRDWKNIIGAYDTKATYVPKDITYTDENNNIMPLTVYNRTSGSAHAYILDNIKKGDPNILGDPYRNYWGVEFLFNKRFSNRWQLLASYIYSKAYGTLDNGFADDIGWASRGGMEGPSDPNFWTNAEGNSTYSPTHQIKIQGSYIVPWAEVALNVYFRSLTGDAWTTQYLTRSGVLAQGRTTVFVEKRGSNHYDMPKILDVRLEKIFTLARRYRLGLIFDVFNVFNDDTITSWGTTLGTNWYPGQYPSTNGHNLTGIVGPRQARLGIRLIF
jgi:hypothetical protein